MTNSKSTKLAPKAPEPSSFQELAISKIEADDSVRTRAEFHEQIVEEYAEEIEEGAKFPPLVVFHDGQKYWLADGFYRLKAAQKTGRGEFPADVRIGGRHEAFLHALGANATHGLRRTNADKRRAVELALADPELAKRSSRALATLCAVTHPFVEEVRAEVVTVTTCSSRVGADKKHYPARKKEAPESAADAGHAAVRNAIQAHGGRSGRGTCRWVARRRRSAAGAVTAEPVRWSAWLAKEQGGPLPVGE